MVTNAIKFSASYIQPNPMETDYWIDLSSDVYGRKIKVYVNDEWVEWNVAGINIETLYEELSKIFIKDAPKDGNIYGRVNGEWSIIKYKIDNSLSDDSENAVQNKVITTRLNELDTKIDSKQPIGDYLTEETDPTVPEWAKEPTKPTYTAQEVGAIKVGGIKTINGISLEGEGNVEIKGGTDGIADAPSDGKKYVRQNSNWTEETKYDLSSYATTEWVNEQQFLTEHQDISNLATKEEVALKADASQLDAKADKTQLELKADKTQLSEYLTSYTADSTYVKKTDPIEWYNVYNKPSWIDSNTKPTYTASEVGAIAKGGLKTINGQSVEGSGNIEIQSSSNASYLDLSMFAEESGTLSEEDYQKIVKAYNDKVNIFEIDINGEKLKVYGLGIVDTDTYYMISFSYSINYVSIGLNVSTIAIDKNTKEYSYNKPTLQFYISGDGTKALTDNGKYTEFAPEAPADDNIYGRKNKQWEVISGGGNVTKESVEAVLTGNIETHAHDSTYKELTYETDMWDGVAIAESVQGKGTKDDPYLISSCAEWIYFWENTNTLLAIDENTLADILLTDAVFYAKLTKSLDFNNNVLPYTIKEESIIGGLCDVNGCGATISNIKLNIDDDVNAKGIANSAPYCRFYNFNIKDITIDVDITSGTDYETFQFSVFNGYSGYTTGIEFNNYIKANVTINGNNTNVSGVKVLLMLGGLGVYTMGTGMTQIINGKQVKFGLDINVVNNASIKEGSELKVIKVINCIGHQELGFFTTPIVYDNSHSNITNYEDDKIVYEGNYAEYLQVVGTTSDYIYVNGDKSNGFIFTLIDASSSSGNKLPFISTQKKTEEEFNSDDFINNILNKEEETFKKGEITPIIKYTEIDYNGYAKQKEVNDIYEKVVFNKNIFNTFYRELTSSISDLQTKDSDLEKKLNDKLDEDYYREYSTTSDFTIPVNKRLCIADLSSSGTLSLDSHMSNGFELCLIIRNKSSTSITIILPTDSKYIKLNGNSFTVKGYKYAEVKFICAFNSEYYVSFTTY